MFFNIEYDTGVALAGYVVADGVNGSVDLVLRANGEDIYEFTATEMREALVHAGRHSTGACGFYISDQHVYGLHAIQELEIRKRDDDMLIYRRHLPEFVHKKILRLETQMIPQWRLDRYFEDKFQYYMNNIENFGRETTTQFFLLNGVNSQYISGRILFRNYAHYIEDKFECIALIQDPFEELAERIFVFHQLKSASLPHLAAREGTSFAPAIEFVENIRLNDEKSVIMSFKSIPDDVAAILSDPLVRQLTTATPGEAIARNGTAAALDVLSSFSIVGLRDSSETYLEACAELINVNYSELPPVPKFSQVKQLANILRLSKQASYLIEKDRELYQLVASAFKKAERL